MLARLERAFERIVEGSIAGVFRLRVQPAEIGRQLERAMLGARANSVGVTLAPNLFDVHLHPDDARAFRGWDEALSREMETWLAELAFARGLATVGPIRVQIEEDPAVRRRSVRAIARYSAAVPSPAAASRSKLAEGRALQLVPFEPGLVGIALHTGPVRVGRASDNHLVVDDPEVSRHHARLEADGGGWRVVDLGSTNGTWVNGARVREATIDVGDDVSFGGARFSVAPE